jgi:hypothetical protein
MKAIKILTIAVFILTIAMSIALGGDISYYLMGKINVCKLIISISYCVGFLIGFCICLYYLFSELKDDNQNKDN